MSSKKDTADKKFSQVLKTLRKERHLSQRQLGDSLHFAYSTIAMWEKGQREPNYKTLELIADFFNVDMNYILGKSNIKNSYRYFSENENLSLLFSAAKDLTSEELAPILAFVRNARKIKGLE